MKKMEIIDCHIHPAIDKETDFGWYQSSGSIKKQFDDLKRAGITKACGSIIMKRKPENFKEIVRLNDACLSIRDKYPDFFIPGIQIHPDFIDESVKEIERCCEKHEVRWIGELCGYLMGFDGYFDSKNMILIMKAAAKYNAVVNIHCADLRAIKRLCRSVPDIDFVLAHPWQGKEFLERIKLVSEIKNLFLDFSGTGIDRYRMLKKALEVAGIKKLLFGTDYPINNPAVYIHGALFEKLSENFYNNFLAGNFKNLFQKKGV